MKQSLLTLSITSFICLVLIAIYELFRTQSIIIAVSTTLAAITTLSFITFLILLDLENEKDKQHEKK